MNETLLKTIALGWIAGIRSMSAPAVLSHHFAQSQPRRLRGSLFNMLALPGVASALKLAAGAEMVGDKLPSIPARIAPIPLLGRAASGALVGAALHKSEGEDWLVGGFIGGVSAVASTYTMYMLRRMLTQNVGVPDPVVALVEDSIAAGGGILSIQS